LRSILIIDTYMLWVYAGLDLAACDRLARSSLPSGYIDGSKTRTAELAETMTTIYTHHPGCSMYLGFLDPLQMLSPPHEAACRRVFRECTVAFATSNPLLIPYSWKNGTAKVVVVGSKNKEDASDSKVVHDGRTPLIQDEA
jgi:hypothetical protein